MSQGTMDAAALNASFTLPPVVTFDDLYNVLRHTLLSPFFTGGLLAFAHLFQKRAPLDDRSKIYLSAYFGITWALWFSSWTSRVWAGKHWRHGLNGLLGLHRLSWDNEIVVVTGGCRGVGKAIVDILDTKKVTVVVLERSIPEESRKEIYNDVHLYECDVSDYKAVTEVFERVNKEVGSPTVLINNAGIVTGRPILELSETDIRNTFNINAIAHFWTIKAVLPKMLERGTGHIVNVSSFLGTIGVANLSDYCASKHALLGLHDSLVAEMRTNPTKPNIHITTVCPGHIRTPLFAGLGRFSAFNAFMFPLQEPYMVARGIVDRIEREQGGELHLPVLGNLSWLWRGLPSWARDGVKGLSQADNLMGDFHRRAKE